MVIVMMNMMTMHCNGEDGDDDNIRNEYDDENDDNALQW